jgi:hypothetical protein
MDCCIKLLNLPAAMRIFGPLRLLWEGSGKGEGIIRFIKPLIHGLKKNWAVNALLKFMQRRSLGILLNRFFPSDVKSTENDVENVAEGAPDEFDCDGFEDNYRKTASISAAETAFNRHEVLSVVQLVGSSDFFMVTKNAFLVPVRSSAEQFVEDVCGASYFYWNLIKMEEGGTYEKIDVANFSQRIKRACLMLPRLNTLGKPKSGRIHMPEGSSQQQHHCVSHQQREYYTIAHDWREINKHFQMAHPLATKCFGYVYGLQPEDI